jgi:hypothetical protein
MSEEEWEACFATIRRSNFLQSVPYAKAQHAIAGQKMRRGLIMMDGKEAGLVLLLEAGLLWNAIHAVILDRGPLWFDGYGGIAHVKAFFEIFNSQFPNRIGRKRRIIPEVEDGPAAKALLAQTGMQRKPYPGYETIWLDLTHDEDDLRAALKRKWRGHLNKAERMGLQIEWDIQGAFLPWFLEGYAQDKQDKAYFGIAPRNLQKMAMFMAQNGGLIIGKAIYDGETVAGILIFCHGLSATYQAGWNADTGREANAHHLLLWQAVNMLKERGIFDFDLGGVNDETAAGVKLFKNGMGGQNIRLAGQYH